MAAGMVVSCPKCEKKFKPKTDVEGKKIKCPFCERPFVVPLAKKPKDAKETRIKSTDAKGKADPSKAEATPAPVEQKKKEAENLEADPNPYDVTTQDLTPRCPYCAKEMKSKNAIICVYCGHNTMTREAGKTTKIFGLTIDRHVLYLLPPTGAAIFAFFTVIGLMINATLVPGWVDSTWLSFIDSEAIRMWATVLSLGILWTAGMFCFKMFIAKPKPDDLKIE
jgi:DNA-directed RNA polymerase subunit RPC12/RpoP